MDTATSGKIERLLNDLEQLTLREEKSLRHQNIEDVDYTGQTKLIIIEGLLDTIDKAQINLNDYPEWLQRMQSIRDACERTTAQLLHERTKILVELNECHRTLRNIAHVKNTYRVHAANDS